MGIININSLFLSLIMDPLEIACHHLHKEYRHKDPVQYNQKYNELLEMAIKKSEVSDLARVIKASSKGVLTVAISELKTMYWDASEIGGENIISELLEDEFAWDTGFEKLASKLLAE